MTTMQIVKAALHSDDAPVMITRDEIMSMRGETVEDAAMRLHLLPGEVAALVEWIKTF